MAIQECLERFLGRSREIKITPEQAKANLRSFAEVVSELYCGLPPQPDDSHGNDLRLASTALSEKYPYFFGFLANYQIDPKKIQAANVSCHAYSGISSLALHLTIKPTKGSALSLFSLDFCVFDVKNRGEGSILYYLNKRPVLNRTFRCRLESGDVFVNRTEIMKEAAELFRDIVLPQFFVDSSTALPAAA